MKAALAAWFVHPATLVLAGAALGALIVVLELLLGGLAELGNVRFQGMLEDHQRLLPAADEGRLHLSRVIDVLRWLEIAAIGGLWLVLQAQPGLGLAAGCTLAVAVPVALVAGSRAFIGTIGEERLAALLRLVQPLAWPLVALLVRLSPRPEAPPVEDEDEEASEREIQAFLEAGEAAGIFEGEEGEIVESLVDFFDTVVREVMTPRTDMVAIPESASYAELLALFADSHKSRIPVYSGTLDSVVGVVLVKGVVERLSSGGEPPLAELVAPCLVVPESKPLGELLRDFQRDRQQLAIVVDEYGGTSGLVTLEDILEEIVGEIEDEHDPREPPEWRELEPGVFRLQGRAQLDILEELFDVSVDEEDVDTVGGLVFSCHGTVPEPGTEVVDDGRSLHFTVEEMQDRRIVSVTVRRLGEAAG